MKRMQANTRLLPAAFWSKPVSINSGFHLTLVDAKVAGNMLEMLLLKRYSLSTAELKPMGVMFNPLLLQKATFSLLHEQTAGQPSARLLASTLPNRTPNATMVRKREVFETVIL